jgi:hypothetical protein
MNGIDKWCAEQCGIKFQNEGASHWYIPPSKLYPYEWTIQDPRCREIVCEEFKIHPLWVGFRGMGHGNYWIGYVNEQRLSIIEQRRKEAEIACITAIYEARDE